MHKIGEGPRYYGWSGLVDHLLMPTANELKPFFPSALRVSSMGLVFDLSRGGLTFKRL